MLVAVSCLLVLLSATVVWAHRTLLDTGTFVGTVGPVFQDPVVASAVAARATDELFTELNLQARLRMPCLPRPVSRPSRSPTPPRATWPASWRTC